jgi:hypothetical protein
MPGFHLSTPSSTSPPLPSTTKNSGAYSKRSLFSTVMLFFGGMPFALLVLQCRAAFSSLSFSKYAMRVALLFGPLAPRLAASAVVHLSGSRTVPWPSVLRLLAPLSFALPDQPPPPDHLKNHLIWVDSIKLIPLACYRMYLDAYKKPVNSQLLSWHYHCNYGTKLTLHWCIKSKPIVLYEGLYELSSLLERQRGPRWPKMSHH